MKKQQKIIELRTASKLKISEIQTKIAFARSETAKTRASLMQLRADELENAETETERFNVIANYRALLAVTQAKHSAEVAQLKAEIQQVKAECEQQCAAAEDDPEPEPETDTEKDSDVTVKGFQPQQTVYCDGSEHSARIVARRLINKMPHIPEGGAITVMISHGDESLSGKYWLSVTTNNGGKWPGNLCTVLFDESNHEQESEASLIDTVRESFDARKEGGNE